MPRTVGELVAGYSHMLREDRQEIVEVRILSKFSTAASEYGIGLLINSRCIDLENIAKEFVTSFKIGFVSPSFSDQFKRHEYIYKLCKTIKRFNSTLTDIFKLGMTGYWFPFEQKQDDEDDVGRLDFVRSKDNLAKASKELFGLTDLLQITKCQRDFSTNSTFLRQLGKSLAFSYFGCRNTLKDFQRLEVDEDYIVKDKNLKDCLAQIIQALMDIYEVKADSEAPYYEKLKEPRKEENARPDSPITELIGGLEKPSITKMSLLDMTLPHTSYAGEDQLKEALANLKDMVLHARS